MTEASAETPAPPPWWIVGLSRAVPVVLVMTVVVWVAPLLAVPFVACMAVPFAFPALFFLALCPLVGIQPGPPGSTAAGAGLLLVGGIANAAFAMGVLTHAQTFLLGRHGVSLLEPTVVGWGLVVWGLLVLGAGLGRRAGVLASAGYATAFVCIGPFSTAILAFYRQVGLPLGA